VISLDRLLDGLDVDVQPLLAPSTGAPALRYSKNGDRIVDLAGGAVSAALTITRSYYRPRRGTIAMDDSGEPEDVRTGGRIRATFQGSVGFFDHLPEPSATRSPTQPQGAARWSRLCCAAPCSCSCSRGANGPRRQLSRARRVMGRWHGSVLRNPGYPDRRRRALDGEGGAITDPVRVHAESRCARSRWHP
jgi:hypothetical protein